MDRSQADVDPAGDKPHRKAPAKRSKAGASSNTARRREAAKADATGKYLARRQTIIDAATQLFKEKGIPNTSMEDVARAAGVDRSAVYYYFASKDELFTEVVIDGVIDVMDLADHIDESTDPPAQKLETLMTRLMTSYAHRYPGIYLYLKEELKNRPDLNLPRMEQRFADAVTTIIREGVDAGEFRSDIPPRLAAFAIEGMLAWTHQWFDPDGVIDPEDVARAFTQLALAGLEKR